MKYNLALQPQESAREALFQRYADRVAANPALTRSLISFQGNKKRPFARWLKYKEAFSAEFVEFALSAFRLPESPAVFDPFAGSATALFGAAERGWHASGTELLPVAIAAINARQAAQTVKTSNLIRALRDLDKAFSAAQKTAQFPHLRITQGAFSRSTEIDLGHYRAFADAHDDNNVRTLLHFAALCVLEEVSYTRKDGQYLRWDRRSGRGLGSQFDKGKIPPFRTAIKNKLEQIVSDIQAAERKNTPVKIVQGSFLTYGLEKPKNSVDVVVTSPPYCNRYDYTRTYALELAYLGYGETQVRDLRQSLLSATVENRSKMDALKGLFRQSGQSVRHSAIVRSFENSDALHEVLSILESAADRGELNNPNIPRMVRNYFFEMAVCISHLGRLVRPGGLVIMVNDNVRYFGEEVPVDLILGSFAEDLGFRVQRIWYLPRGKGNSSQQMGAHGRSELRKCVYVWRRA